MVIIVLFGGGWGIIHTYAYALFRYRNFSPIWNFCRQFEKSNKKIANNVSSLHFYFKSKSIESFKRDCSTNFHTYECSYFWRGWQFAMLDPIQSIRYIRAVFWVRIRAKLPPNPIFAFRHILVQGILRHSNGFVNILIWKQFTCYERDGTRGGMGV